MEKLRKRQKPTVDSSAGKNSNPKSRLDKTRIYTSPTGSAISKHIGAKKTIDGEEKTVNPAGSQEIAGASAL